MVANCTFKPCPDGVTEVSGERHHRCFCVIKEHRTQQKHKVPVLFSSSIGSGIVMSNGESKAVFASTSSPFQSHCATFPRRPGSWRRVTDPTHVSLMQEEDKRIPKVIALGETKGVKRSALKKEEAQFHLALLLTHLRTRRCRTRLSSPVGQRRLIN